MCIRDRFYHVMILAVLFIIINFLIYVLRGFFRAKYLKNVMFSLNHDLFKGIDVYKRQFIMSQPASLFSSAKRLNLFSPIRKYFDASSMVRVYFSHTGISLLFIRYPLSHVSCHTGYRG